MINPAFGQAAFSIAVFVTLCSLGILPFEPRGSAEFVAAAVAAVIGILGMVMVVALARIQRH